MKENKELTTISSAEEFSESIAMDKANNNASTVKHKLHDKWMNVLIDEDGEMFTANVKVVILNGIVYNLSEEWYKINDPKEYFKGDYVDINCYPVPLGRHGLTAVLLDDYLKASFDILNDKTNLSIKTR